ncbi:hypothetical protein [Microbacterium suwonense]|uniref:GGDEF domain-containing protein n=1 Tax=Microbacterium suwonense TaxID=683047 RepID=A0ABN6X573_9MICO|nr:hypothetical protein [Microbacterium suwonense]BDZ39168.1 hypothetical protein GCM10025863_17820 [Microbacterium suwonense]
MITSSLVMPVIAITTLATIVYISLGFLPRPSRASAIWSATFAIAMIGSYVWMMHEFVATEQMRAIGSGLVIAPMPLIWSGLRAYRESRRQYLSVSVVFLVAAPLVLLASTYVDAYGVVFRLLFTATALFAILTFIELLRLGPRLRDEALPLMGVSAAFMVFTVMFDINGVLVMVGQIDTTASLQFIRTLNLIGIPVYVVCTLVTTLLLTVRADAQSASPRTEFERTARNRLDRARAAGDEWWSLLDIRLDDPDHIRSASGTAAFNAVSEKFAHDVDAVMPADADIDRINTTQFVVLLPRSQGGVRELLPELLDRVSTAEDRQSVPIRLSASIGWAPVSACGHDFGTLVARAAEAAVTATEKGGDRWERVRGEAD